MRFTYREFGEVLRPVIPVVLSYGGKRREYEVLIDSGSDKCFFDADVVQQLGIPFVNCDIKELFGIKGVRSLYYSHPITISVGDTSYRIEAGFVPSVAGGVVPYGFVGQKGFFDRFMVRFNLPKNEIEVKEAKN